MGFAYQRFRVCLLGIGDCLLLLPELGACNDEYGQLGTASLGGGNWGCSDYIYRPWKEILYTSRRFCGREEAGRRWSPDDLRATRRR